jgi:prepilin-type N-terminal cleavage/methylation domain-containing protein
MIYVPSDIKKRLAGFTLIELLVTITIIGILVAIVYTNFSQARMQARDKMRMNQLEQLRVALELYKDKYGKYPDPGCGVSTSTAPLQWVGAQPDTGPATWYTQCDQFIDGLVPEFLDELPIDPSGTSTPLRGIIYRTTSTNYKVLFNESVETLTITNSDYGHPYARCPQPNNQTVNNRVCGNPALGAGTYLQPTSYAIYSAGAWSW